MFQHGNSALINLDGVEIRKGYFQNGEHHGYGEVVLRKTASSRNEEDSLTRRGTGNCSTDRYERIQGGAHPKYPNHNLRLTTGNCIPNTKVDPNLISSYCGMFRFGKPDGLGIEFTQFDEYYGDFKQG